MQAEYPTKLRRANWDPLNLKHPTSRFPATGVTSEIISREWRPQPETISSSSKRPVETIKEYMRDYQVTKELHKSQTILDFGLKHPETKRFNKHTSLTENLYIYPPSRQLTDKPPQCRAHGTTEMREAYRYPIVPARLVTDKDQSKHPDSMCLELPTETIWNNHLEPLDTTHEGFEKYLDPYLTTSRLHHRPYTADQLNRPSVTNDVVTYYTCGDVAWVRSPKPDTRNWHVVNLRSNRTSDRETFKKDLREIRTHNKQNWIPGAFRTEIRDNYRPQSSIPVPKLQNLEEEVKTFYDHALANLPTKIPEEDLVIRNCYGTENSHVGSGKALCAAISQHVQKNKRLERKSVQIA